MARSEVLIKPSAVKEIEAISSKRDRRKIVTRIGRLADDPRPTGARKLSGRDLYRLRQGRYRILYSIVEGDLIVYVVRVAHRRNAYR